MSDPQREQLPLLCDDISDEDYNIEEISTAYKRRFSPNTVRSKYQIKGAAAIIKHWPDHVSSLFTYWWMGLAMIGLTVFIIYNSVVAFAILPPQPKLNTMQPSKTLQDSTNRYFPPYKTVYMHLITNDVTTELNDYMPYIEIISKAFPTFKYNLVVLYNDTLENIDDSVSDFQKNKFALKKILKDKNDLTKTALGENIFIERKSMTAFMNESPIKKYWRHLPDKFTGFLIRCISIWNKGGISMNPILLTPKSPNPNYVDKIKSLLKNTENPQILKKHHHKHKPRIKKYKKKVNNIQDIIENFQEDSASNVDKANDISLDKEETMHLPTNLKTNGTKIHHKNKKRIARIATHKNVNSYAEKENVRDLITITTDPNYKDINKITLTNGTTEQRLFPMLMKYLFSPTTDGKLTNIDHAFINTNQIDEENLLSDSKEHSSNTIGETDHAKEFSDERRASKTSNSLISIEADQALDLTLDLKGNLIASTTPCHALLGTIFNNVIHHIKEDTVTDFIISELSFFCKGTWRSCKGVNVIF